MTRRTRLAAIALAGSLVLTPTATMSAAAHERGGDRGHSRSVEARYSVWDKGKKHGWHKSRHHHNHHGHSHRRWWERHHPSPSPSPSDPTDPTPSPTPSPDPTATVEPSPTPTDPATAPPASGETSGGSGGPMSNREDVTFTSSGQTSTAHIYAEGRTGSPGLLFWTDGTGGNGYHNPDSSYLIGGAQGMEAIARERNMILVVPLAPGSNNVWYDDAGERKAQWSSDLMTHVKSQYDIDLSRVAIGGYSSGAQWTTNFFMPVHGEEQSVDLFMPFAYGGPPRADESWSAAYKAETTGVWNTGTNDHPAYDNARRGYAHYTAAGFDTEWEESSEDHSRSGQFGPFAAQNIDEHLGE